ncbi:WhiB family transcriptional regulator [Rhodococcoides fascians A21d2]|uniref:WhiB family transcriptional regulator n=1 Tax=Rhodococcoides fascians TaxID=1828 RepID=UPI0009B8C859|nr:WhiB family transcriptional regulator [Rhodococcus fascians]QII03237.1 WhiB family transcriptional regulator [Rhodococcus fascians A21d2]
MTTDQLLVDSAADLVAPGTVNVGDVPNPRGRSYRADAVHVLEHRQHRVPRPSSGPRLRRQHIEWQSRARCRGLGFDLFFKSKEVDSEAVANAKRICGQCPVSTACLRYVIDFIELQGIWGGTTPSERRWIRLPRVSGTTERRWLIR